MSLGHVLSGNWKDVKDAFSGKNIKDPFAHLGSALSPGGTLTEALTGWNPGDLSNMVADKANANFAQLLHGDGVPGVKSTFKNPDYNRYAGKGGGFGDWVTNKPASTVGALITAAMFGGGGLFGGGTAGEGGANVATDAFGTSSAGLNTGGAVTSWAPESGSSSWLNAGNLGKAGDALTNMGKQQQQQDQRPLPDGSNSLAQMMAEQKQRQLAALQAQLAQLNS